jgi:hypothetical protein
MSPEREAQLQRYLNATRETWEAMIKADSRAPEYQHIADAYIAAHRAAIGEA